MNILKKIIAFFLFFQAFFKLYLLLTSASISLENIHGDIRNILIVLSHVVCYAIIGIGILKNKKWSVVLYWAIIIVSFFVGYYLTHLPFPYYAFFAKAIMILNIMFAILLIVAFTKNTIENDKMPA